MSEQPKPKPGREAITPRLIEHLQERAARGLLTYGRPLETHNGRDALADALDEALDMAAEPQTIWRSSVSPATLSTT